MQVKLLLVRVRMQVCLKILLYRQVIEGGEDNDVYECVAGYSVYEEVLINLQVTQSALAITRRLWVHDIDEARYIQCVTVFIASGNPL